jgi:uncharacterized protein (DUF1778 family)
LVVFGCIDKLAKLCIIKVTGQKINKGIKMERSPRESKAKKWGRIKQDQWGEKSETVDGHYKTSHDYFMHNFLSIDFDRGCGLGYVFQDLYYNSDNRKFGVGEEKAYEVICACKSYLDQGMEFKINGKIDVPADTSPEWNIKHYTEGLERVDDTIALYGPDHYEDPDDEDELAEKAAKIRRMEEVKYIIDAVFQRACDSDNNVLEKNMAGIIDEDIAKYINTLQKVIENSELSEDDKLTRVQKMLDKMSQMKQAELYILGIQGTLSEYTE